ncbi:MAG: flagellar basal body-associated FliL family protein [Alphaproteobacteria bacterium]
MTDVTNEEAEDGGLEGEDLELGPKKSWNGKRLVLFIILPAVMFLLALGALFFVAGLGSEDEAEVVADETVGEETAEAPPVYVELPEMLVNLNAAGRRTSFLKIKVALEVPEESDIATVELRMPRVMDHFQVYLRELRAEDLRGSAGIHRLREELLARVRAAVEPIKVNDVLFTEMLVQ